MLGHHVGFGRGQYAFQTAQQREWQDDAAVLRLFKVTTKQISDRPDKGGGLGEVFGHSVVLLFSERQQSGLGKIERIISGLWGRGRTERELRVELCCMWGVGERK